VPNMLAVRNLRCRQRRFRSKARASPSLKECLGQWLCITVFCIILWMNHDSIALVVEQIRFRVMRLTQPHMFHAPLSIFAQKPEGRQHLPPYLFTPSANQSTIDPAYWIDYRLCEHTKSGHYSADSKGALCKLHDIGDDGCCPPKRALHPMALGSDRDTVTQCTAQQTAHVPYHLFTDNMCECHREHSMCVLSCMQHFEGLAIDTAAQGKFEWDACNFVCASSSKSTVNARYYRDPTHKFCFGNEFFSSTEYGIVAALAPSCKVVASETLSCSDQCAMLNEKSHCSPRATSLFSDDCSYHAMVTGDECSECRQGSHGPVVEKSADTGQVCYKSRSGSDGCSLAPAENQANICMCFMLSDEPAKKIFIK